MIDLGIWLTARFQDLVALINGNWLLRDAFVCGLLMFCLDLIFSRKDKEDK